MLLSIRKSTTNRTIDFDSSIMGLKKPLTNAMCCCIPMASTRLHIEASRVTSRGAKQNRIGRDPKLRLQQIEVFDFEVSCGKFSATRKENIVAENKLHHAVGVFGTLTKQKHTFWPLDEHPIQHESSGLV